MQKRKYTSSKITLVLAFMMLSIILSGCGSSVTPAVSTSVDQMMMQEKRVGLLQSLGGAVNADQATHILRLEDGTTLMLKSSAINLDDVKYINNNVEVRGAIAKTADGTNDIMNVALIDVVQADQNPVAPQVAPQWKTYQSTKFDVGFKYRDDFDVQEDANGITLVQKDQPAVVDASSSATGITNAVDSQAAATTSAAGSVSAPSAVASTTSSASAQTPAASQVPAQKTTITLAITPHLPTTSLLSFLKLKSDSSAELSAKGLMKSKIGVQSLNAYKKSNADSSQINYYVDAGTAFYGISFASAQTPNLVENQNLFYDLINSLDFQPANAQNGTVVPLDSTTSSEAVIGGRDDVAPTPVVTPAVKPVVTPPVVVPPQTSNTMSGVVLPAVPVVVAPIAPVKPVPAPTSSVVVPTTTAVPATDPASVSVDASATADVLPGFILLDSPGFKFSLQYPKSYYYGSATTTETGVIRRYDFGSKPTDETPGEIGLDIMTGKLPSGPTFPAGANTVTKVSTGSMLMFYVKGSGTRLYRISGPVAKEEVMMKMAGTLKD